MRRGRDRVGQRVTNGVSIAAKRVESGLFNLPGEPVRLGFPPGPVGAERPTTAASNRACRHPSWSRVRSTMIVTARSVPTLDGRRCAHRRRGSSPGRAARSDRPGSWPRPRSRSRPCASPPQDGAQRRHCGVVVGERVERRTRHRPERTTAHPSRTCRGPSSGLSIGSLLASDPEGTDALNPAPPRRPGRSPHPRSDPKSHDSDRLVPRPTTSLTLSAEPVVRHTTDTYGQTLRYLSPLEDPLAGGRGERPDGLCLALAACRAGDTWSRIASPHC